MNTDEFLIMVSSDLWVYLIILTLVFVAFIPLFKRYVNSIFNPFFLSLIMTVFAYTVPFFLYKEGLCSEKHLTYFVLSEFLYWVVFVLVSLRPTKFRESYVVGEAGLAKFMFIVALVIFLFTSIYTYTQIGIPLFMRSRLEVYSQEGGTGIGILGRFQGFSQAYILLYSFMKLFKYKNRKFIIFLILVFVDSILGGSKGGVMTIVNWFFIYAFFLQQNLPKIRLVYIPLILSAPIMVLIFSGYVAEGGIVDAFISLLDRFAVNGDAYYKAYPYDTINQVKIGSPLLDLFKGVLAPFRIISTQSLDDSIGLQLAWTVNPQLWGITVGPNARLAVMGWVYFRWAGLIFSAITGWFAATLMFRIRHLFTRSFLGIFLYGYIFLMAFSILTDPAVFWGQVGTFLMNIIVYGFILILISGGKIVFRKYKPFQSINNNGRNH